MQTILIAIDDQVISMLLSEELFGEGYSIRTISDPWMLGQTIQKSRLDLLIIDESFGGAGALIFVWNSESTFSKLRSSFGQAGSQYSGGPKKGFPLISMFSRRTLYRNSHRKYAGG